MVLNSQIVVKGVKICVMIVLNYVFCVCFQSIDKMSLCLFDRTLPFIVPMFLFPPTCTRHLPESDSLFSASILLSMAFQKPALIIKDSQAIRFVVHRALCGQICVI